MQAINLLAILVMLAPLFGAFIVGLYGNNLGVRASHWITILGIAISFGIAIVLANLFIVSGHAVVNNTLYNWLTVGALKFQIGVWIDTLTVIMLLVVNGISLLVHIYSIGYMHGDPGYSRFFAYMSLFTFAMNVLVLANNGLQLFFGWEGVGVVSYLLISFWFKKPSATAGGLKAFLVNRVGDLGFLLGLALCLAVFGSLDYNSWFVGANESLTASVTGVVNLTTVDIISLLLFIGAMGKSAQIPLHVWLPESMEGPTPISALIHAATMVTAGVYMISRLSPLFEMSAVALNFIMVIGSTGALFLGLIAIVQNDIKKVVAYSTLSQLGYMIAATGASAYSAAVFHLVTHACFKALLFLGAGSVIVAMHHEQDMRKMGGLKSKLPITYNTFLLASISLAALPPFAGFFSKDSIIAAVQLSVLPGSSYASFCLITGAMVTAFYSFRAVFMTFFGRQNYQGECHESPWSICIPLLILVIPSVMLGFTLFDWMFANSTIQHMSLAQSARTSEVLVHLHQHGVLAMIIEACGHITFWLTIVGIFAAWLVYLRMPHLPNYYARRFNFIYTLLINKYGFDKFNDWLFVRQTLALSHKLLNYIDKLLIDKGLVHGVANIVKFFSVRLQHSQTGYLYHYTAIMGVGILLFVLLSVMVK